jgi:hypothetical protein
MKNFVKTLISKKSVCCLFRLSIFMGILTACSSQQPRVTTVRQKPTQWDHKTIRERRDAEQSLNESNNTAEPEVPTEALCTKVTEAEMRKAKMRGCRPLDPKEGHGIGTFCCEQEN